MTARATEPVIQRRAIQPIQLRRSWIDHQILRGTSGVITTGVRQRLEQADVIGAHGLIL